MPSAPSPGAGARREAERPTARREVQSYDWYEETNFTTPAGTAFVEAFVFSGRPDAISFRTDTGTVDVRLRDPGNVAGSTHKVRVGQGFDLNVGARIVEARDPSGVGGLSVFITGRYASRHIERRDTRHGPTLSDVRPREQGAPEQLEPRY